LSAIARAALRGVLFKGGLHLERLSQVELIALDKTGTITVGQPTVTQVWTHDDTPPDELLTLAASVERHSEHHLGEAIIQEAQRRGLSLRDIDEFENHTGQGVHALVDGLWVGIGREAMFRQHGLTVPAQVEEAVQKFRQAGQTALI